MISSSFVMMYNNPQVEFHRNVLQFWWIIIFFKCFRMQVELEKKIKGKKRKGKKRKEKDLCYSQEQKPRSVK